MSRNNRQKNNINIDRKILYTVGGIIFGLCLLLLLTGMRLEYLIPFHYTAQAEDAFFVPGSLLAKFETFDSFTSFGNVLLSSFVLPAILILGLHSIGHILVFVRRQKFIKHKSLYDIIATAAILIYLVLDLMSAISFIWKAEPERIGMNLFSSIIVAVFILLIALQALTPYICLLVKTYYWKKQGRFAEKNYLYTTPALLIVLSLYLFIMNLFSFWGWSFLSTILLLFAFVAVPIYMVILFGECISSEDFNNRSITASLPRMPSISFDPTPTTASSSSHRSRTDDASSWVFHHYKTTVNSHVARDYENGLYDVEFEATFYFRNAHGQEETKTVNGFRGCINSDTINASDAEYLYGYMLDSFSRR